MTNGFIVIDKDNWDHSTAEQRDWMIFNTLQNVNERLSKLEKRPIIDKVCSFVGGVLGGALAFLGLRAG